MLLSLLSPPGTTPGLCDHKSKQLHRCVFTIMLQLSFGPQLSEPWQGPHSHGEDQSRMDEWKLKCNVQLITQTAKDREIKG